MPCITVSFDPAVGPVINLGIAKAASIKGATADKKSAVIVCNALVDTGADVTCISPELAAEVGLRPIGKRRMATATSVVPVNTYLVDIVLTFGAVSLVLESIEAMECQLDTPHYQALLGRDMIANGLFSMTGYDKRFTICM